MWYVYMVRCADESLYSGITTDIVRRLRQHNGEASGGARYTLPKRPVVLVYLETKYSQSTALKRETEIKKLSRIQKLDLIRDH